MVAALERGGSLCPMVGLIFGQGLFLQLTALAIGCI